MKEFFSFLLDAFVIDFWQSEQYLLAIVGALVLIILAAYCIIFIRAIGNLIVDSFKKDSSTGSTNYYTTSSTGASGSSDLLDITNPLSPLSPLNPTSPLNPLHDTLFSTNNDFSANTDSFTQINDSYSSPSESISGL